MEKTMDDSNVTGKKLFAVYMATKEKNITLIN